MTADPQGPTVLYLSQQQGSMTDWTAYEAELASGEADCVNSVIDEIEAMDLDERVDRFDDLVSGATECYTDSDDGYVRQACVRFVDALAPTMAAAVDPQGKLPGDDPESTVRAQTDETCGFFLDALTDDDGRVRQSAERGLVDACRTYETLDDGETVEAVAAELADLAEGHEGKIRESLLDAKESIESTGVSMVGQLLRDAAAEFDN